MRRKSYAEKYTVAGIPTKFRGVLFRSRLEAKWAAFFTSLGLRWIYEPFDCPGWIPDFALINSKGEIGLLVDVKPWTVLNEKECIKQGITPACGHEVLITACEPFSDGSGDKSACFVGWVGEIIKGSDVFVWSKAYLSSTEKIVGTEKTYPFGIRAEYDQGKSHDKILVGSTGGWYKIFNGNYPTWLECCNDVMWHKDMGEEAL